MLENDVGLGQKELVAKQTAHFVHVDLVEVVLVKWALETTQTFENLKDLALSVSKLNTRVLLLLQILLAQCR